MYNRGHKPKGVVIHNTAGTASATQEGQRLTNMTFQQLANGVAHVYIDKNTIYETLPEDRIAWHVAQQYGNTEFYGIEVCGSRNTDKEQFLANEQVAFQEAARRLKVGVCVQIETQYDYITRFQVQNVPICRCCYTQVIA